MSKLLTLIFICIVQFADAQNNQPTKSQLFKIFKNNITQNNSGKVSIPSNPWIICNKDSAFYKSDTLILHNTIKTYYNSGCCDFIDWTFYKKNAFVLTNTRICKEPPTSSVVKNTDWFTIKLFTIQKDLFLETTNQGEIINTFKVVSIDSKVKITLVKVPRLNK